MVYRCYTESARHHDGIPGTTYGRPGTGEAEARPEVGEEETCSFTRQSSLTFVYVIVGDCTSPWEASDTDRAGDAMVSTSLCERQLCCRGLSSAPVALESFHLTAYKCAVYRSFSKVVRYTYAVAMLMRSITGSDGATAWRTLGLSVERKVGTKVPTRF